MRVRNQRRSLCIYTGRLPINLSFEYVKILVVGNHHRWSRLQQKKNGLWKKLFGGIPFLLRVYVVNEMLASVYADLRYLIGRTEECSSFEHFTWK